MIEANTNTNKAKAKPAGAFETPKFETPKFETPRFEIPKFEIPKMEVPVAFRELAEKGVVQAKENYEKLKAVAEEATDVLEATYSTASKGSAEYGLKVLDAARANTNATFDFLAEFMNVKSLSEAVELSTAHMRKQFEAVSAQTRELTSTAQKVANDASEPLKNGVTKAFNKAAA
jgi:phasin